MQNNDTELSPTNILNRSYDAGLDVIVVEQIGADGVLKNPATEAKQDTLLTELEKKADLTETQPVFDEGNNIILRELLDQNNIPLWYDATTNRLQTVTTGTLTTVTTVTTVTTLTGQTNIGGIPADPQIPSLLNQTWQQGVRNLLI